ncbi:MAG: GNAT family N-acetyltransferase [Thermomicrobiales bacterium]
MERRRLIEMKLALEFGVGPDGDTLPEATLHAEGQPRLLVSRFGNEHAIYFRHDVPLGVREELSALGIEVLMNDEDRVRAILIQHAACEKVYRIRWHTIERMPAPSEYPDVTLRDGRCVVIIDGKVVAWARTDNEDSHAAEVSIATKSAFRRRGFARQVTAAWAVSVLSSGKVAFYSHLLDNTPSSAVAASLGLEHLSDEIEYL